MAFPVTATCEPYKVAIQIHTLWRTAVASCELVSNDDLRVLLWIGRRLVYDQVVASIVEASTIAAELKRAYAQDA